MECTPFFNETSKVLLDNRCPQMGGESPEHLIHACEALSGWSARGRGGAGSCSTSFLNHQDSAIFAEQLYWDIRHSQMLWSGG